MLLQVLSTSASLAGRLGYSLTVRMPAATPSLATRPPTSVPPTMAATAGAGEPEKKAQARQPSASVRSARASAKARLKAEGAAKRVVPEAEILQSHQQQPSRQNYEE